MKLTHKIIAAFCAVAMLAAGTARAAVSDPIQAGALPRLNPSTMLSVNQIVVGEPTPAAIQSLMDAAQNLSQREQNVVMRSLPARWKAALGL